MAIIKVETKNQSGIDKKPRVYFTCHPEDFEKYFRKICSDIFKTHDCAIYYTEDMTEDIPEEDWETDLGRNNLFVVPVTLKLLSTPNRAMDVDIPYALQEHIPVLPFMMEQGSDALYSRPDKFGQLQYLDPYSSDGTEISYEQKLKKYLESVLISDELAKRVRAAFDAYIFLSYRKKDRRYANELMRLIHSIPECRDIAIWFDEFLTPGESFRESIDRILHDSKLFALLVTPNLLEESNFVMTEEYPAAHKSGIPILPTEMEDTDGDALRQKFPDIPDSVKPSDEEFRTRLLETVTRLAARSNNTPEHNYLIGLAYLDGIDVEVNRQHALELITSAAEKGLPDAIVKLYQMYDEGIGVTLDYRKAALWAEKYGKYMVARYGEEHPDTLIILSNLAVTYGKGGDHKKSLALQEKVYALRSRVLGEEHPETLTSLNNLAVTYGNLGEYQRALVLKEKVYVLLRRVLGKEHPNTLTALSSLAVSCIELGDYQKAFGLQEKAYDLLRRMLGEEHPVTLNSLSALAFTYGELGEHKRALGMQEKAYALQCKVLGEEHPDALNSLNSLAIIYRKLGDYKKALELQEKIYTLQRKVLGEEHPATLTALNNLAVGYSDLGDHKKALELQEKEYVLLRRTLGQEHPSTLVAINNLAFTYCELGDHKKALELQEKAYALRCKVLGEEHPDTLFSLSDLALTFDSLGDHQEAKELWLKAYPICCKVLGKNHPHTVQTLNNIKKVKKKIRKIFWLRVFRRNNR